MPKIDINEAKKLAKLSRLEFTEKELENFMKEFDKTLEYVKLMDKIDTENVALKENAKNTCILRNDQIKPSFSQQQILKNAPEQEDGSFLVPTTVEEGGA